MDPDPFEWLLQVFTELAGDDWSNRDALRACIGDINADSNNDMMQAGFHQNLALHALLLGMLHWSHIRLLSGTWSA